MSCQASSALLTRGLRGHPCTLLFSLTYLLLISTHAFTSRRPLAGLQRLIYATPLSPIRYFFSTSISSHVSFLHAPAMKVEQTLFGRKGHYLLSKRLEHDRLDSTVFKAKVLLENKANTASGWSVTAHWIAVSTRANSQIRVLIKTATSGNENTRMSLEREYNTYQRPTIASSPCIQALYDIVEDPRDFTGDESACLVLEWMDYTLAELRPESVRNNHILLKAFIRASLSALDAFKREELAYIGRVPFWRPNLH